MGKPQFNEKQIAAITLLSQPRRADMTYEQIAKEVGVSRQTLINWRNNDKFMNEVKRTIMRNSISRLPDVMESIPDHIINGGNAAMFRTFLQAQGLLTEKVEVETSDKAVDLDAIRKRVMEKRKGDDK